MADTFEELLEAIEAHGQNTQIVSDLRSRDETRYETFQSGPLGWQTSTKRHSDSDNADALEAESKATLKEALDAYVREQVLEVLQESMEGAGA